MARSVLAATATRVLETPRCDEGCAPHIHPPLDHFPLRPANALVSGLLGAPPIGCSATAAAACRTRDLTMPATSSPGAPTPAGASVGLASTPGGVFPPVTRGMR